MTDVEARALPSLSAPDWVTRSGVVCMAAGVLGAGTSTFLAVYPGQAPEDMVSHPLTAGGRPATTVWMLLSAALGYALRKADER